MNSNEPDVKRGEVGTADTVLPLIEEELRGGSREVVTGRVRVRTANDTAEELVRQELQGERVEVERVPVGQLVEPGAEPPQVRTEGNVTILPVLEEVLVVEKRLFIKEELRITRQPTTEIAEIPVTVRKQRAVVERLNSEGEIITALQEQEP
jgi:stress response protein YsnF